MIKLFYKSYDYKMSLGAMRDYARETDRCLWRDLLAVMESWSKSATDIDANIASDTQIATHRIGSVCDAVPFNDAVYLFKALIDAGDSRVSIDEIDDAMFRAGMIPSDRPDDCGEPWPLVLVKLSHAINSGMVDSVKKKPKADISQD